MSPGLILDIIVIAAIIVSAVIAFLRGFIREVLTILGVVGGVAAAYFGGPLLAPLVHGWMGIAENTTEEEPQKLFDIIPYPMVADAAAYGGIFIVVVIGLSIFSHFLSGWAKAVGLGAVDRTFGVAFGIVRGVVLLALLYLPVFLLIDTETRDGWFGASKSRFYVESTASFLAGLLPESMVAQEDEEEKETLAETTREKLQELDVLKEGAPTPSDAPAGENESAPGYEPQQREILDNLIEGNVND